MPQNKTLIQFSQQKASQYFFIGGLLSLFLFLLFGGGQLLLVFSTKSHSPGTFNLVLGALIGIFFVLGLLCRWYANLSGRRLEYWIEDGCLRINEGVVIKKRKSIPIARITDIVLVQGPILSMLGLWKMNIQTAGSSNPQMRSEGILHGVEDPEGVRQAILGARK